MVYVIRYDYNYCILTLRCRVLHPAKYTLSTICLKFRVHQIIIDLSVKRSRLAILYAYHSFVFVGIYLSFLFFFAVDGDNVRIVLQKGIQITDSVNVSLRRCDRST